MPVQKTMVPKFTCSDGTEFLDELDANVHEADLTLKRVVAPFGENWPVLQRSWR